MHKVIENLVSKIKLHDGINDKAKLSEIITAEFKLTRDRSVYYCDQFAIRFSSAKNKSFANTVLSLSRLQKFDDRPFIVCVVTPDENHLLLANSSLLRKISHSSQELRVDNIRGSFNGSDISRELDGIANDSENLLRLYRIHSEIGFKGNLARLVEATNNISPTGSKFVVSDEAKKTILLAPSRASEFLTSKEFQTLKDDLDAQVDKYSKEILLASLIENVNVRGRVIEYLIAGEDEALRSQLIESLRSDEKSLPPFKTDNTLGDYVRVFEDYSTATDVKTKIMVKSSNPKAYNIDKMLKFLASPKSVFLFYIVGIDEDSVLKPILVSIFQKQLLQSTITLRHWAGRNSRGVTQFDGSDIGDMIRKLDPEIDNESAKAFLTKLLDL